MGWKVAPRYPRLDAEAKIETLPCTLLVHLFSIHDQQRHYGIENSICKDQPCSASLQESFIAVRGKRQDLEGKHHYIIHTAHTMSPKVAFLMANYGHDPTGVISISVEAVYYNYSHSPSQRPQCHTQSLKKPASRSTSLRKRETCPNVIVRCSKG